MSRKRRIHHIGGFYHIMVRGNNGQPIFFSDSDRCKFLLLLQEMSERFGCRIHGFCLMSNHVHLVLQVSEKHISAPMHDLLFRYTRYINQKQNRIGHLFQGRFKSILVEEGDYLIELIRYVHLNPVRAGIVSKPEDYRWSSHRVLLGRAILVWLTVDWVLNKFDVHENIARKCYEKFVNYEVLSDNDVEKFKHGSHEGRFLGTDEFVKRLIEENNSHSRLSQKYSLNDLIMLVCEKLGQPLSVLKLPGKEREGTKARSFVAYFVKRIPHLTLKELADFVGRDASSLSKLARKLEHKSNHDESISLILKELSEEILRNNTSMQPNVTTQLED